MSSFLIFTLGVPTICYFAASAYLVATGNKFDAMMFVGYAFANVGVMLRLSA